MCSVFTFQSMQSLNPPQGNTLPVPWTGNRGTELGRWLTEAEAVMLELYLKECLVLKSKLS